MKLTSGKPVAVLLYDTSAVLKQFPLSRQHDILPGNLFEGNKRILQVVEELEKRQDQEPDVFELAEKAGAVTKISELAEDASPASTDEVLILACGGNYRAQIGNLPAPTPASGPRAVRGRRPSHCDRRRPPPGLAPRRP